MGSAFFMPNEANLGWSRKGHRRAGHAGGRHADKLGRLWIA